MLENIINKTKIGLVSAVMVLSLYGCAKKKKKKKIYNKKKKKKKKK